MRDIVRILFHLSPVLPFLYEKNFLGVAAILGVGLFYIKTYKISQYMEDVLKKEGKGSPTYLSLEKLRGRWSYMTYLKTEKLDLK